MTKKPEKPFSPAMLSALEALSRTTKLETKPATRPEGQFSPIMLSALDALSRGKGNIDLVVPVEAPPAEADAPAKKLRSDA